MFWYNPTPPDGKEIGTPPGKSKNSTVDLWLSDLSLSTSQIKLMCLNPKSHKHRGTTRMRSTHTYFKYADDIALVGFSKSNTASLESFEKEMPL